MVPFAHAGHWIEAAVYMVPIGGFAVWLGITTVRDRRKEREEAAAGAAAAPSSDDDVERTAGT
jgi:hypothetical protein